MRVQLQLAALELYRDHGFDQTTAAEIAGRAGVTERTFFRHFADKREVLFDGEAELHQLLKAAITAAPATLGPLDRLLAAFQSVAPMIEAARPFAEPRHEVVIATPALYERDLSKMASLTSVLTVALQARGVEPVPARLASQVGVAAFRQAALSWFADPTSGRGYGHHLDETFRILRALSSENRAAPAV